MIIKEEEVKNATNTELLEALKEAISEKEFYEKAISEIESLEEQKEVNNEKETGKSL